MLKLRNKLMIILMSTTMVFGLNAGLSQLTSVSAHRVKSYRYYRHHAKRHYFHHRTNWKRSRKYNMKRKHSYRYKINNKKHRAKLYRRYSKKHKFSHRKFHVKKNYYHTKRHIRRYNKKHNNKLKVGANQNNESISAPVSFNNQLSNSAQTNQSTSSAQTAQPNSNYDIGVSKLTKLFIGWGYDPDDAKSDAKSYMNGESNTSTGSPEIDAILDQYQNPSLRGNTSSNNAPDPNLPTAPQTSYAKTVENRTLYDMNQDRASIGEGPLQVTSGLTHLAEERAVQLTSNFDHYDQNGNDYDDEDDPNAISGEETENICESFPGQSAKQAADMMNNSLFYQEHPTQDQPYGGGHYNSIATSTAVGVGFYDGALAEEFH